MADVNGYNLPPLPANFSADTGNNLVVSGFDLGDVPLPAEGEKRISAMETTRDQLQSALSDLEQKISVERREWEERMKTKEMEIRTAKDDVQRVSDRERKERDLKERELHNLRNNLEHEIKTLEQKLQDTRDKTWVQAVRTKEEEMTALRVESAIKESQLRAIREQKEKDIAELREKMERKLSEQVVRTREEYDRKLAEMVEMQANLKEQIREKEFLINQERDLYNERLKAKEAELMSLRNEQVLQQMQLRSDFDRRIQSLETEKESLRFQWVQKEATLDSNRSVWEERLHTKEEEINLLKSQINTRKEEIQAEFRWKMESSTRDKEQLQILLHEKDIELTELKRNAQRTETEVELVRKQVELEFARRMQEQERFSEQRIATRVHEYEVRLQNIEREKSKLVQDYEERLRKTVQLRPELVTEYEEKIARLQSAEERLRQLEAKYVAERKVWEKEVTVKDKQIYELKTEFDRQQREWDFGLRSNRVVAEQERRVNEIERQLIQANDEKMRYETELRQTKLNWELQTTNLNTELAQRNRDIKELKSELDQLRLMRVELETELRRTHELVSHSQQKIQVQETSIRKEYEDKLSALTANYERLVSEFENLTVKYDQAERILKNQTVAEKGIHHQPDYEKRLQLMNISYQNIMRERDILGKRCQEYETLLNSERTRVDMFQKQYDEMLNQQRVLQTELNERDNVISQLKDDFANLQAKLGDIQTRIQQEPDKTVLIQQVQIQYRDVLNRLSQEQKARTELLTKFNTILPQVDELQNKLTVQLKVVDSLQSELTSWQERTRNAESKLTEINLKSDQEVSKVNNEKVKQILQLNELVTEQQKKVSELESLYKEEKSVRQKNLTDVNNLTKQVDDLSVRLIQQQENNSILERDNSRLSDQIKVQEQTIAGLQGRIIDLENKIKSKTIYRRVVNWLSTPMISVNKPLPLDDKVTE